MNNQQGQAIIHSSLGTLLEKLGVWDRAEHHHNQAIDLNKTINNKQGEALSRAGVGRLEEERKNYQQALEYSESALELNREINNSRDVILQLSAIGRIHAKQRQSDKAHKYNQEALELAKESENNTLMFTAYRVQSLINAVEGDKKAMLESLQKAGAEYSIASEQLIEAVRNKDVLPENTPGTGTSLIISLARGHWLMDN
ncbi:MAG: tetratricopeptide repeat protein, partial [bacterium]